jgi:hypothetical protein
LASRLGYVFADNTVSIKELLVTPIVVASIIKSNQITAPLFSAQLTVLQQSTIFLQNYHEKIRLDDNSMELIEIENDGLKLADKWHTHIAFPINACASTASTS